MKICQIPPENRPRERFENQGPQSLSNAELFSLFLDSGIKGLNVIDVSNNLLRKYDLQKLSTCSFKEIQKIRGIGKVKAIKIAAIFELMKRQKKTFKSIRSAKEVFDYLSPRMSQLEKEQFVVLHLNARNKLLKTEIISIGTANSSIVHAREVFKTAIRENVSNIILVHNHPSGITDPSPKDIQVTKSLLKSSRIVGITILDHVIIGDDYFSFLENKLLS